MYSKSVKLKSGIVIHDNRSLGCGVVIENPNHNKYIFLSYSSKERFYLNISSSWLTIDDIADYYNELEMMRLSLVEVNELFKRENLNTDETT
jgi:hypothetical protein